VIGRIRRELAGTYFVELISLFTSIWATRYHDERSDRFFNPGSFFANDFDELCNCKDRRCKSEYPRAAQQSQ